MEFSLATPPVGVTGPLVAVPPTTSPGCNASDYDSLPVNGAVVLVDRGTCPFAQKEAAAVQRGAVAMVIADNVVEEQMGGTLGEKTDVKIPVVSVTKPDGALLRLTSGPATVKLSAETKTIQARNVIAQTKTGLTSDVVMAGAHLDSVPEGPGINDNGSGVAAVLETALQLGSSPEIHNAVRFGFWGAEELGLIGSRKYIESLDVNALKDIALYLNFDMLASPNPGYFTYDGDQSLPLDKRGNPVVPEGSAGIERSLAAYLNSAGKTPQDTSFDGRSDYDGFTLAGIPSGGLFSGAENKKTAEQAKLWGGAADQPFDPNYHKSTDTLDHIDRAELGINGGGVAYATGLYAQDRDRPQRGSDSRGPHPPRAGQVIRFDRELQTGQADRGSVAGRRTMRRWISLHPKQTGRHCPSRRRGPRTRCGRYCVPMDVVHLATVVPDTIGGVARNCRPGCGLSGICGRAPKPATATPPDSSAAARIRFGCVCMFMDDHVRQRR